MDARHNTEDIREVKRYGLRWILTPEMAEDPGPVEAAMRAEIAAGVESEGYVALSDTYRFEIVDRSRIDGEPFLIEEERDAGLTGEERMGRMTVDCYARFCCEAGMVADPGPCPWHSRSRA